MKLRVLDLFSGIGGFSLGLERARLEGAEYDGFETVAFCEIEEFPRKVLAKHWPDVPCYQDVRELTAERLTADGIAVDVITGGFPCQDISFAGKGAGLAGERSGLFYEIARLIGELGPGFVILENVGALLSRGLDAVLGTLASLGYDAQWHSIPASALGACHHRDRIWIIAHPQKVGARGQADARFAISIGESLKRLVKGWPEGLYPDAWQTGRKGGEFQSLPGFPELSWGQDCGSVTELIERAAIHAPALCRTDDGIPNRVDRVGACGNAVVPQIPELIGTAILQAIHGSQATPCGFGGDHFATVPAGLFRERVSAPGSDFQSFHSQEVTQP